MITAMPDPKTSEADCGCGPFPELVRMNYFHGQMLSPRDFLAEQAYHRAKHLLINRCLHGYGVVCGLDVTAIPTDTPCPDPNADKRRELDAAIADVQAKLDAAEKAQDEAAVKELDAKLEELRREREALGQPECPPGTTEPAPKPERKLTLGCGLAIDPSGHEIVVRNDVVVDLDRLISDEDWTRLTREREADAWLSICYVECGTESVRPGTLDQCQITPGCQDARIREGWTLHLSLDPPASDDRCEFCCNGSCDTCVLIGRIHLRDGQGLRAEDVYSGVRRPFGLYAPTVITGINWIHGGTYSQADARTLSGADDGSGAYEFRFSRPIRVETIQPGVVELLCFSGGRGESGTIKHIPGEFLDLPASGTVDRIRYRDVTGETPQRSDRILIQLRCDFLLDACCRPVDGNHVGGRVPTIDAAPGDEAGAGCARPPGRGGAPWTSGNGTPGGLFESWFFISKDKESKA